MPLPRLRPTRAKSDVTKATEQRQLESLLEGAPGSLCSNGDILNLPGWQTSRYKESDQDIIIQAAVTAEQPPSCNCGAPAEAFQRWGFTPSSYVYDLPIRGKRTRIYFRQRRYHCSCGRTFLQARPGVDERRKLTSRLAEYIGREAFNICVTFSELANEVGVSEKTVRDIFTERAERLEKERVVQTPRWLAIDEVHVGKRAHCVITDPERRQVLDILPDDGQGTVAKWLLQLPNRHQVEVVTMDMSLSYLGAVRRVLSESRIVVDRYHVHNLLNIAIKDVLQVIRALMPPSEQRKYMRDPRLLFKSRHNLSDEPAKRGAKGNGTTERVLVARWLEAVPDIGRAYWLKEHLSDILQLTDRTQAEEQLDRWLEEVWGFVQHFRATYEKQFRGRWDEPFGNVMVTVSQWRPMILNYIDCKHRYERKITNAFAEYANREIGKAYLLGSGYAYEVLRLKLIHGGLLVSRRPPHPLDEPARVVEKGRAGKRRRKNQGRINPKANVVRLERIREERDETKNLLVKPQDVEDWAARFGELDQPDLSFDQGVWEPPKKRGGGRRKEKDKPRGSGKRARPPRTRGGGQINLF